MKYTSLLAVLLLVTAATTPALAAPNEAPLADAGLDQTTTRGTTVYLDAGGSRDPDGTVTDYEWTVEAPNGSTTTLDCRDCEQTQFPADTVGEHEVALTVTDDDGATATDTLYVDVNPGEPPSVTLSGPAQLATGERATYSTSVSAGAAPLDRVVWYVDGDRHSSEDIEGTAASTDQRFQFPDSGSHKVRAVAVDADDQRGNATRTVTVSASGTVDTTGDPTNDDETNDANPAVPDIEGPRVVTGHAALEGTYSLTDGSTGHWFLDDHHAGTGTTATLPLTPGTHELYATPDSGGAATFPDGGRTIVADPAPDVSIERIAEESVVTVDAYATDELANLQSVEVLVDGDLKRTETVGGIERRSSGGGRLTILERFTAIPPGDRNITVRATDSRGQTDSATQTIHVPGPPEVRDAGFVNDEPLTSRHPKLDPEDYTGEFEIDIDLNGVRPEYVKAKMFETDGNFVSMGNSTVYKPSLGYDLTIRQNYSRIMGGEIIASGRVLWERGSKEGTIRLVHGQTRTKASEPIIRLDLVDSENRAGDLGATFNASASFDPDQTDLNYRWGEINGDGEWGGPVKQLHPRKLIYLEVTDEQRQSNRTYEILDWFTPGLQTPAAQNTETIFPQDTVTYRVRTKEYELSQAIYEKDKLGKLIDFELVSDVGSVGGHSRYWENENGGSFDQTRPEGAEDSYIFHEWFVSLPASEFLDEEQPTVRIQSTNQEAAFREVELPDPKMYDQIGSSVDLWEFDVEYVEQRPDYEVETTAKSGRKDALQRMGFDLYTARQSGTEYHLEKRVKAQPAQWETITRDFGSRFQRELFLENGGDWRADGSTEKRRERAVTESVWRGHRGGGGEFTGDTRRVRVEPAEVETLREYEYETEYTVEVTEEEERESCLPGLGCRTYTVETTTEETRTTEHDYWSSRPRNPTHHWTGDTRTRTIERAEYDRQYEYLVEDTETYWDHIYHASTREKVQPAQYEWQHYETVTTERAASVLTTSPDIRQASTEPTREWTLRREDGTVTRVTDTPQQRSRVVETRMTARAHVEARYLPPNPSVRSEIVTNERVVDVTKNSDNFVPVRKAKNIISGEANETYVENL